jgi:hypothetical protein
VPCWPARRGHAAWFFADVARRRVGSFLAVLLIAISSAGCLTPDTHAKSASDLGTTRPSNSSAVTALQLWPEAAALSMRWQNDATPAFVTDAPYPLMTRGNNPALAQPVDGRAGAWVFGFVSPSTRGSDAFQIAANGTVMGSIAGNGSLSTAQSASAIPAFQPAWLATDELVRVLAANATAAPFTGVVASSALYSLIEVPGPRGNETAWVVQVSVSNKTLIAFVAPGNWTVLRAFAYAYASRVAPIPCVPAGAGSARPENETHAWSALVTPLQGSAYAFHTAPYWEAFVVVNATWRGLPIDDLNLELFGGGGFLLARASGPSPLHLQAFGPPFNPRDPTWLVNATDGGQTPVDANFSLSVSYLEGPPNAPCPAR